jgi:predicted Zn-dependent peptidase
LNANINKKLKTLDNGLKVCAISFPGIKTVTLRCIVFVGSIFETPDHNGISHFLEHMLFRGNQKLGSARELSLKMEALGGELNAVTSFDLTEFWLDYHLDFLEIGIEQFCQFLQFPIFEQLEIERSIILEEIKADYNEENQLVDLDTLNALALWPTHPIGLPITGNEHSLTNITKQDLEDWFQRYYQPGNMILSTIGDFDPERVIDMIGRSFLPRTPIQRQRYRPINSTGPVGEQLQLVFDKDNQHRIQWAFPRYPLTPELRVRYQLIRRILDDGSSSRLQRDIREEKGLVYDITADMLYFNSGTSLSIECLVSRDHLIPLMETLVQLLNRLIEEGVTQSELALAQRRYALSLDCGLDTAHGVLFETVSPLVYPEVMTFPEIQQMITTVRLDDINQTLRTLLDQKNSCFTLVGPWQYSDERQLRRLLAYWLPDR